MFSASRRNVLFSVLYFIISMYLGILVTTFLALGSYVKIIYESRVRRVRKPERRFSIKKPTGVSNYIRICIDI